MKNSNSCIDGCGKVLLQAFACMTGGVLIRASNGKMGVSGHEKLTFVRTGILSGRKMAICTILKRESFII